MNSNVIDTMQNIFADNLKPNTFKKDQKNIKRNRDLVPVIKSTSLVKTIFLHNKLLDTFQWQLLLRLHQLLQQVFPSQFTQPTQCGQANKEQNI